MIRYLETEEKGRCLDLWREAFPEDSTEFCDYYFKEKMKDNRVLVREENGEIVSMIHRNPYRIYMRGNEAVCDYIVGVSTLVSERHKGYMRSLMLAMLRDMQEERMPFTFLMPARESLYRPHIVSLTTPSAIPQDLPQVSSDHMAPCGYGDYI